MKVTGDGSLMFVEDGGLSVCGAWACRQRIPREGLMTRVESREIKSELNGGGEDGKARGNQVLSYRPQLPFLFSPSASSKDRARCLHNDPQ